MLNYLLIYTTCSNSIFLKHTKIKNKHGTLFELLTLPNVIYNALTYGGVYIIEHIRRRIQAKALVVSKIHRRVITTRQKIECTRYSVIHWIDITDLSNSVLCPFTTFVTKRGVVKREVSCSITPVSVRNTETTFATITPENIIDGRNFINSLLILFVIQHKRSYYIMLGFIIELIIFILGISIIVEGVYVVKYYNDNKPKTPSTGIERTYDAMVFFIGIGVGILIYELKRVLTLFQFLDKYVIYVVLIGMILVLAGIGAYYVTILRKIGDEKTVDESRILIAESVGLACIGVATGVFLALILSIEFLIIIFPIFVCIILIAQGSIGINLNIRIKNESKVAESKTVNWISAVFIVLGCLGLIGYVIGMFLGVDEGLEGAGIEGEATGMAEGFSGSFGGERGVRFRSHRHRIRSSFGNKRSKEILKRREAAIQERKREIEALKRKNKIEVERKSSHPLSEALNNINTQIQPPVTTSSQPSTTATTSSRPPTTTTTSSRPPTTATTSSRPPTTATTSSRPQAIYPPPSISGGRTSNLRPVSKIVSRSNSYKNRKKRKA